MKHIATIIALLIFCLINVQAQKILKPTWSTKHVGKAAHFNNSGTKLLTCGGNGIDVWDNKVDTLLYSFTYHSLITDANFSHDDSKIAASTTTGSVFILDAENGEIIYELNDGPRIYKSVQLSKNKDLVLATSERDIVCVWSVITGELVTKVSTFGKTIGGSSFSNNGLFILIHYMDKAEILDSHTGESVKILEHPGTIITSQFDNNDERIITAINEKEIKMWESKTGEELYTLTDTSAIYFAEFSEDGKFFLYTSNGKTELRKTLTGEHLRTFINMQQNSVARFNKSGEYIISGADYGTTKLWNIRTGELRHDFPLSSQRYINNCEFEPNGKRFLVTSGAGIVAIYDTTAKAKSNEYYGHSGHKSYPKFKISGKKIFSASEDGSIKVWNAEDGRLELLDFYAGNNRGSEHVQFCSNNTFATMAVNGQILIRDMNTLEVIHDKLPKKFVWTKFIPTCKQLVYEDDNLADEGVIEMYDIDKDSVSKTIRHKGASFYPLHISTLGNYVVSTRDSILYIWSLQSGAIVHSIKMINILFKFFGFANDTTLIVGRYFPHELLWIDIKQDKIIRKYTLPDIVHFSELIKDETRVLVIGEKNIMLWHAQTGELLKNINVEKKVSMADFSEDEKLMITAVDGEISIYNTVTMEKIVHSEGFGTIVYAKFNETADRIVTADNDGKVRVWNPGDLMTSSTGNEYANSYNVTVSPNPATDEITIHGIISSTPITYTFTDIIGTVITHGTIPEQTDTYTLSTRNLPSGFYNVTFQVNGTKHTEKLTVVH